ncbi:SDR family NAD(P)-dependent oxidoreductase [Roseomonas sp. 18066]|uniref:SDR family NAD(P)-dependent oxidoreductase n=1 Tax=Roseomonas sp. 18066 TaxID=2681412 RepID=UPI0013596D63|nr:SDR family NAD(P)-dependent oxidoreductase [Roseomonas sp. 18066]
MTPPPDSIAVIGMAGRFPGAPDLSAFWRNLLEGRESIRRADQATLRAAGFDPADPRLVPAFGVLDDVDRFDAGFFGFPARRAARLDPQQRLLLECAWQALDHAGYGPGSHDAVVGTFLSMTASTYGDGNSDPDLGDGFFDLTSRDKDYAASRIAWRLDLTGPAMMVQSACSGALLAVHQAAEALLSGQCDMALAGGCSVTLPQGGYRQASGLMLSATGRLRAFDAAADGAVPGNGLGLVVLKPLSRALADGDTVLAVIRGSAVNNDGARKADYLAPSVAGQRRAILEALAMAEVPPASLGMVECHGTGTALGDPVEIRALGQAHDAAGGRGGAADCRIGSVKGNIGHLNAAGGIAGLIKAVLSVQHGRIPPSLFFNAPNPEIDLAGAGFAVATRAEDWPAIPGPRRAAVSAFGFGGTNVHMVLEQAPTVAVGASMAGPWPILLSARDEAALDRAAQALAAALEAPGAAPLADIAWTLATGRQAFSCRRAVVAGSHAEAARSLRAPAAPPLDADARRWCAGETIDWRSRFAERRRRVPLPSYPFAPERHWLSAPTTAAPVAAGASVLEELRAYFAAALQEAPEKLDPDAGWDRFGIDSLLVGTLTAGLRQKYPSLRSTALFEHGSLRKLAAHLAGLQPTPAAAVVDKDDPRIAVIGLSVRLPGAPDLDAFWDLLREGRSGISEIPAERWNWRDNTDKKTSRWGGFIADVDRFDPLLFGIAPREARMIDPQARLVLQAAWHALEDAGHHRASLKASAQGRDVGVFMGVMNMPWRLLGLAAAEAGMVVQGNHWSVANRVSHAFDFGGPSLAVDTGCSASLTALHLACDSLRRGECGVALAGGVNLVLHPVQPLELARTGVLASGPDCHVFGAAADGFVQGEGVGVAVLKPLAAALRDGDAIHGVILGSAVNAGGRTAGYTVPNPRAQAAVVARAIANAGVPADSISYVECHGTATALGDPVEIAGLADGLRAAGRSTETLLLGSAKSNIGHLESAAGIAGLTKLLLQLRHGQVAPSLHAHPANPAIDFAGGGFAVAQALQPWRSAGPRRGGVSSFGAGGANAHLLAEEAPPATTTTPAAGPFLVVLSARTAEALRGIVVSLAAFLEREAPPLADLAWTLAMGREALEHRLAIPATDLAALTAALRGFLASSSRNYLAGTAGFANEDTLETPDLAALARHWIAGGRVDWARIFAGQHRQRLRLPRYPFARERCWLPEAPPRVQATTSLLGPAIPTLSAEARWRIDLTEDNPLLGQHRVGGRAILPGVGTLPLVAAALRQLGRDTGALYLRDLAWLAPAAAEAGRLRAELALRPEPGGLGFALEAEGRILSRGRVVEHSDLANDAPLVVEHGDTLDGTAVYARLAALGLDYGPAFRAIVSLSMGEDTVRGVLASQEDIPGSELQAGMLDAVLQSAAMLVFRHAEARRLLPLALEAVDILGPLPRRGIVEARRLTPATQRDAAVFDALLRDEAGRVVLRLRGLAGRIDRTTPAVEADPPLGDWLLTPGWIAAPATGAPLLGATPPRILAATPEAVAALPGAALTATWNAPSPETPLVLALAEAPETPRALFRLLQAMRRAGGARRLLLLALAGPEATPTPWCAAAFGLLRTAAREWPDWQLGTAWLADWHDAPATLAEPGDALSRDILWRDGVRQARALQPRPFPATGAAPWPRGGHAVILGGAGGIGRALAQRLAQRHGMRLSLIGRRPADHPAIAEALATLRQAGAEARYHQADAAAPGALAAAIHTARAEFGPVQVAIHSAIDMRDASLERMAPEDFEAALAVKAEGSLALAAAVAEDPLEQFLLFSSVNAFAANAGQANYVAGCAFKDALGLRLAAAGRPARVINWGFWGEVGRVADAATAARLARRGVEPIATAEGLAALDAILSVTGPVQVAVLKGEARLRDALGVAAPDSLQARMQAHLASEAAGMAGAWDEYAALEALSRRRLLAWWNGLGLLPAGARRDSAAVEQALGLVARHQRLFAALIALLAAEGALSVEGATLLGHHADPGDIEADLDGFAARLPAFAPHVALLRACAGAYTAVLRGERLATEVMFPESSLALVEGIYRGNRMTDYCNRLVAAVVRDVASGGGARILEVGAGTGGTSRTLLPLLDDLAVADYVYTDVSLAFAQFGRREFGVTRPWLSARALDISRDPLAQGLAAASCDAVLGANVVHATPELVRSLSHARSLLKPGGVLVLYEMTAIHDFGTLTFGLLDGWWKSEDPRLPHAPLLDAAGWRQRLAAAGFADVFLLSEPGLADEASFRHSVIVARNPLPVVAPPRVATPMRDRLRRRAAEPATPPAQDLAPLVAAIRDVTLQVLELRAEELRDDRSFADYGADSILGVALVEALGQRLGVALSPTVLFSHQSVDKLARHLAARHGAALTLTAPAPAAAPVQKPDDRIAIIGMAGRFPGAENVEEFWKNMLGGVDSVGPVPMARWDHAAIFDRRPQQPGRSNCDSGGFLSDIESFDPLFFGLSPAEAIATDPQQRLFLETAWQALEHAAYGPPSLAGLRCGVFAGNVAGDYGERLLQAGQGSDARSFTGNAASMLAARIAYRLDLHGPCLSVDTACSSSLVAVHLAAESLKRGECDLALAGGVALMTTSAFHIAASQAGMLAPGGRCRTLDAAADGFVPAEAVACLVLKRLADAERDGDTIQGVILGSGMNQDGASNGITAPNGTAQAALLRQVWRAAGISPGDLGYVELHGTGTRLGDPVEIQALREAFSDTAVPPGHCAIGSAKAQLGHTLAAAGVVGLLRAMLALRDRRIPPAVNFSAPNPLLGLDDAAPFRVPRQAESWPADRRCAAVSAFGFSGTNAHVVLAAPPAATAPVATPRGGHLAVLSAETAVALQQRRDALAAWLHAHPEAALNDICASLALGRAHHRTPHRLAFAVSDRAALRQALDGAEDAGAPAALQSLATIYRSGDDPDWVALHPPGSFRRLSLPPYPFARRRCWPDTPPPPAVVVAPADRNIFAAVMAELDSETGGGGA